MLHRHNEIIVNDLGVAAHSYKAVERITMGCGVYSGVLYAQAAVIKITADTGKQVRLIGGPYHDLYGLVVAYLKGPHYGLFRIWVAGSMNRVPGNVMRLVAHKILSVQ